MVKVARCGVDDDPRALCIYEERFYEVKLVKEVDENTPKHKRLIKWHGFKKIYEEWKPAAEAPLLHSTCAFKYRPISSNKRPPPKKKLYYSLWKSIFEEKTAHHNEPFGDPFHYIYYQDMKNIDRGMVIELELDPEKNAGLIFDEFVLDTTLDSEKNWLKTRSTVIDYLKRLMKLAVVKKYLLFEKEIGYAETWLQNKGFLESNTDINSFCAVLPPAFVMRFLIKLPELMTNVGLNKEQLHNMKKTVSEFCDWLFRNCEKLAGTKYEHITKIRA